MNKLLGIIAAILIISIGIVIAAPTNANGLDFRPQQGVAFWTGNGGFISWWPDSLEHHFICKGTEKLPQAAFDNMVVNGWWLSNQGPGGSQTICKQAY